VRKGLMAAVEKKTVTYDLARQMEGARELKCSEFGEAIIKEIRGAGQKG